MIRRIGLRVKVVLLVGLAGSLGFFLVTKKPISDRRTEAIKELPSGPTPAERLPATQIVLLSSTSKGFKPTEPEGAEEKPLSPPPSLFPELPPAPQPQRQKRFEQAVSNEIDFKPARPPQSSTEPPRLELDPLPIPRREIDPAFATRSEFQISEPLPLLPIAKDKSNPDPAPHLRLDLNPPKLDLPFLPLMKSVEPPMATNLQITELGSLKPLAPKPQPEVVERPPSPKKQLATHEPASEKKVPVRYVNQPRLAVAFSITKRGTSGVRASELWASRDGEDWRCIASKNGDTSPIHVSLSGDGKYSLRMLFVAGSGRTSGIPVLGDEPDECVILDTTPPELTFMAVRPDEAREGVDIAWRVKDANLHEEAIQVEWSGDGREWNPITGWIGNIDSIAWKAPEQTPSTIYFRVIARDKAGNESEVRTRNPINIDTVVPKGKVTGIVDFESLPQPKLLVE